MPLLQTPQNLPSETPSAEEQLLNPTPEIVFSPGQEATVGHKSQRGGRKMKTRPDFCLNCGHDTRHVNFCPNCGQENISYSVPLGTFLADMSEEFMRWDGRLLRTLKALLFRPGLLTREYGAGRRVCYVSPFKLYFVVSALFVTLLSLMPLPDLNAKSEHIQKPKTVVKAPPAPTVSGEKRTIPAKPQQRTNNYVLSSGNSAGRGPIVMGRPVFPPGMKWEGQPIRRGNYLTAYNGWQNDPKNTVKDRAVRRATIRQVLKMIDTPEHFLDELRACIGKAMFFLLPVYALLLSALFRGARRYYVEHLVFAVHQHTVAFLIGSIVTAVGLWAPQYEGWALLLILGYWVYEFCALRRVYGQGKRLTFFKQFVLGQLYGFALMIGLLVTILVQLALL